MASNKSSINSFIDIDAVKVTNYNLFYDDLAYAIGKVGTYSR
jgi:hypothetical protein